MTINELILKLQEFPQESQVIAFQGWCGGSCLYDIFSVDTTPEGEVSINIGDYDYYRRRKPDSDEVDLNVLL